MANSLDVSLSENLAKKEERRYAISSLLRSEDEFQRGELLPLSALDAVDAELANKFSENFFGTRTHKTT